MSVRGQNDLGLTLKVSLKLPLAHFELSCSFEAAAEVVVLFGASGAGKTSILDCLAGFRSPAGGEISLGARQLFSSNGKVNLPVRQRRVGYLSQLPALFPHLSVRQNVGYGLLDLPRNERHHKVGAILERLRIAHLAAARPAAISGGEQQRVALARILVCEPELLLLDEPLSALDARLKSLLLEELFEWQSERAVPMLYVTHDQAEAYSLARRVLMLSQGKIVADGSPRQVFTAPVAREQAALSGFENVYEAVIAAVHPELGTMSCRLSGSGLVLETPLADKRTGESALLALRAGDILLATAAPTSISARNVLAGQIVSIEDRAGMIELRVVCEAHIAGKQAPEEFVAHITRGAMQSLSLQCEQPVWLIIKTHSIQLLRQ